MIRLIAGISFDRAIGVYESKKGKMPWGLNEARGDLALFRALTDKGVVIMGRKTWESIGSKPLTNRICIIVSSKPHVTHSGKGNDGVVREIDANTVHSVRKGIEVAQEIYPDKNIWIMGGVGVFKEGMQYADEIFLTIVPFRAFTRYSPSKLVYFPTVDVNRFKISKCETHPINPRLRIIRYGTSQIGETTDDLRRAYQESTEKIRSQESKKQERDRSNREAIAQSK